MGSDTRLCELPVLNTGEKIQHPKPLKHSLNQLRKLNKAVDSQFTALVIGGNNAESK